MIMLGRDRLNGGEVFIDDSRARAVLICGKRGSGKSYTMGVLLEELVLLDEIAELAEKSRKPLKDLLEQTLVRTFRVFGVVGRG